MATAPDVLVPSWHDLQNSDMDEDDIHDGGCSEADLVPEDPEGAINGSSCDSPRMPDHYQPLQLSYELLEYAGDMPQELFQLLGSELEARDLTVESLRNANDFLVRSASCSSSAGGPLLKALPAHAEDAESHAAAIEAMLAAERKAEAKAEANAERSAKAIATSQKLQFEVQHIEEETSRELARIANRITVAEELRACRECSAQAKEDELDRAKLREAQAELHRLREHAQQLEHKRNQTDRRLQQRDQELRLSIADLEQLRAEVLIFRAQATEFERVERQEEDLQRELREAKSQLKRFAKASSGASLPAPAQEQRGAPSEAAARAPRQRARACSQTDRPVAARSTAIVETLQRAAVVDNVDKHDRPGRQKKNVKKGCPPPLHSYKSLPIGGSSNLANTEAPQTPKRRECIVSQKSFSLRGCASRAAAAPLKDAAVSVQKASPGGGEAASLERSPLMSMPTPLRALFSLRSP